MDDCPGVHVRSLHPLDVGGQSRAGLLQSARDRDHGADHDHSRHGNPRKRDDQRGFGLRQNGRRAVRDRPGHSIRQSRTTGRRFPSKAAASPTSSTTSTGIPTSSAKFRAGSVTVTTTGEDLLKAHPEISKGLNDVQKEEIRQLPNELKKWGLLGAFGIKDWLKPLDDACRSPFLPYGFSGLMAGAALVFFAYIGFDSISTHSEEAMRPQARRSDRHSRVAGLVHGLLHPDGGRHHGNGAVPADRHGRRGRRRVPQTGGNRPESAVARLGVADCRSGRWPA